MAALTALVVAVVAAAGLLTADGLREHELARIDRSLLQRSELARAYLAQLDPGRRSTPELQSVVRELARASDARVTLIDDTGHVLADSELSSEQLPSLESHATRPEIIEANRGRVGRQTRTSATVGRPSLYLALPLPAPMGPGVVRLAVDLDDLDAAMTDLRREIMSVAAAAIIAALVLSFPISGLTLRPVEELREVLAELARGNFERRLRWTRGDELGEIATSLNQVAEQLRKRLTQATSQRDQLELVLASMVEGVLVVDHTHRIALANPTVRVFFGATDDVEGELPIELVECDEIDSALREAATSREPIVREFEVGPRRSRTLLMTAARFARAGKPGGTVAVFHDVSEIRRLEKIRRDFVANASHELRTPLTPIQGFADTLLSAPLEPNELKPQLEAIARNAARMGRLVDDLLVLSQIESRAVPMHMTRVDFVRLAESLISDRAKTIRDRSLQVSIRDEGAIPAHADPQAAEQILSNLLDNAIRYTEADGSIEIICWVENHELHVRVEDTGIGIPATDLDRIFERFYRVDASRSRALGGTGLGLSIVKHLVLAMGGSIDVDSRIGRGSTFTVTLPACSHGAG